MIYAFDLFGTVFDMSGVPAGELRSYGEHLREFRATMQWGPLNLPPTWNHLPAYRDSQESLQTLRQKGHRVVTLSNAPLPLTIAMSRHAGIEWDAIIPLEAAKVYKPDPRAYQFALDLLGERPDNVVMVTGNRTFGDLEAANTLGMWRACIRDEKSPWPDLLSLSQQVDPAPEVASP